MRTKQRDTDEFEAFYKDVRGRLLLQAWGLTGDLTAGRKAVQDALVIAWHHWRKVGRLDRTEREDWVRPIAWRRALRRRSVPHFHRAKDGDEEAQATLTALSRLPLEERKVLLLGHLSTIPEDALAREVGLTQARAEQVLRSATRNFQLYRSMLPIEVLPCFESMAATVAAVRWPRPTILTRAGSARRRTHTAVGLGLAVAAFAGSGFAVTDSAGERPSLDSLSLHRDDSVDGHGGGRYALSATTLLAPEQFGTAFGGAWTTTLTSDDRDGTTTLPCQRAGTADEHPRAALMRTFAGAKKSITSAQSTVASSSSTTARAAYDKTLSWYGGCRDDRMQLLDTRQLTGVGDQATVMLLRDWKAPQRTIAVGVARTGVLTTAVAGTIPVGKSDDPAESGAVSLLGSAVRNLCGLPGAGACTAPASTSTDATTEAKAALKADTKPVPPPASGAQPALVNEVDLPPVSGVDQPWVGTQPAKATTNVAATRCDQASFTGPGIRHALTRSFVIPTATDLAPQFGLTETVGAFGRQKAAAGFVADVRAKLATCPKKDLGSHVTSLTTSSSAGGDITAWRVRVETSKTTSVVYLMAIVRRGAAVAQIGFVPSGNVTMDDASFTALAIRAADRLTYLK